MSPPRPVPDFRAICLHDRLTGTVRKVDIITPVIKAIDFTTIMFEEIVDLVGLIIIGFFRLNGNSNGASGSEPQQSNGYNLLHRFNFQKIRHETK